MTARLKAFSEGQFSNGNLHASLKTSFFFFFKVNISDPHPGCVHKHKLFPQPLKVFLDEDGQVWNLAEWWSQYGPGSPIHIHFSVVQSKLWCSTNWSLTVKLQWSHCTARFHQKMALQNKFSCIRHICVSVEDCHKQTGYLQLNLKSTLEVPPSIWPHSGCLWDVIDLCR